jgi:hypothetical protein
MEDSLKDVLNFYEVFCNELADIEHSSDEKEKINPEVSAEVLAANSNNSTARKAKELEIIEEKDSAQTTSDYSPVDRIATEPNKRKRES